MKNSLAPYEQTSFRNIDRDYFTEPPKAIPTSGIHLKPLIGFSMAASATIPVSRKH
jgi:hypothetical protein